MAFSILGQMEIDGTTKVVDTWYELYDSTGGAATIVSMLTVCNHKGSGTANVSVATLQTGESSVADKNIRAHAVPITGGQPWELLCGYAMEIGASIWVKSSASDVSFDVCGDAT